MLIAVFIYLFTISLGNTRNHTCCQRSVKSPYNPCRTCCRPSKSSRPYGKSECCGRKSASAKLLVHHISDSASDSSDKCTYRSPSPLSLLHLLLRKLRQLHRCICPRVEHLVFKCLIVQAVCHCGGNHRQHHYGCGDLFFHNNSFGLQGWKIKTCLKCMLYAKFQFGTALP